MDRAASTRFLHLLVALLLATGIYLYGFPGPSLLFAAGVLLHLGLGLALSVVLLRGLRGALRGASPVFAAGMVALLAAAASGLALVFTGATRPWHPLLYAHMALGAGGTVAVIGAWLSALAPSRTAARAGAWALVGAVVAGAGLGAWYMREPRWRSAYRITNPTMPPASMDEEGMGPRGPFFPSSARTASGGVINASFFMDSAACQRCHQDIYDQWYSSMHHFSSFNNQWYRKSIEYMQDVVGPQPSKWCGGCHDPALLFTGLMDTPIEQILDRPEAHAGLGCVMCHSIVAVDSTMGQGGFTLEYSALSELAASERRSARLLHDFLVYLNPEPHRRSFLKPLHTDQTAEFCSTCHKVHLDAPVNAYRWIRGFNDYDNWQASGVSGMGARSFYYPPEPQKCVDCHMPPVRSSDAGNKGGYVKSHRFLAANTAVALANRDETQLELTKRFLEDDIVTLDVFALSREEEVEGGAMLPPDLMTTFAVGEEGSPEMRAPGAPVRPPAPLAAPLDRAEPVVRRGDSLRVDVVARTRKVGHFFPGGTVDAFDVWIELKATDDRGRVIFWSGFVEDDGQGPVEPSAHFYRSLLVDAHGNPIDKRNVWAARALVYVRLIPPGAADTIRYRLEIPPEAGDTITLEAKLHYRKFAWFYTQFAFAGEPDPAAGGERSPHFDDRRFVFTGDTSNVSGQIKDIPDVPIVTLSTDRVTLRVAPADSPEPDDRAVLLAEDWTRWNDYGIALLLQGDLKGAEAAFLKVTEIDPENPDGWVNVGRVRVQEGNVEGARDVLEKALALDPDLARTNYFFARVLRAEGQLEEANTYLARVVARYPKDRVVRNDYGRNLFLLRRYAEAVEQFEAALAIDPEDLTAHYNLMLSYNGLGDEARALQHQARYLRFKADESAQALTGPYRLANPHDNRERQAIHEHRDGRSY
jgi:tetratricopeptide (TPR) repeat protein